MLPLTTGDQIEKLNDLLIGHQNNIKDIFSLHQDPVAMGFLEHELAHITNVLQDFVGFLNDLKLFRLIKVLTARSAKTLQDVAICPVGFFWRWGMQWLRDDGID